MDVSNIYSQKLTSLASKNSSSSGSSTEQDLFLKILSQQVQNQNPFDPVSETEWISQMAQFESVNKMQELNTKLESLLLMEEFAQGTMMIGHEVSYKDPSTNETCKGVVKDISISDGEIFINVDGKNISLKSVNQIFDVKE